MGTLGMSDLRTQWRWRSSWTTWKGYSKELPDARQFIPLLKAGGGKARGKWTFLRRGGFIHPVPPSLTTPSPSTSCAMPLLQRLVFPAAGRHARVISRSLPNYVHPRLLPLRIQSIHTPANDNDPNPPSTPKPKQRLAASSHSQPPKPRHEVHERTESLSVPGFNPPGGGGGPGPGGTSVFEITRSPFFDAVLTTIIGLGMGKRFYAQIRSGLTDRTSVFVGGIAYVKWYKKNVLDKVHLVIYSGSNISSNH